MNSFITGYFLIALVFIGVGVGLTVSSYVYTEQNGGGVFFVFWGLVVVGILMLIRAGVYAGLNRGAADARIVPV